jgi:hypothetical protein
MPSITTWTRFEPQTRNAALTTSVQGRIHDPLWLLARQWQVGEFQGEDSGTPIMARLRSDVSRLTRFFPGPIAANSQVTAPAFNAKVTPLETMVERERVRPLAGAKGEKLRFAVEAAQHFFRLLDRQPITPANRETYRAALRRKYPFAAMTAAERSALDADSLAFFDLMSARVPDGRLLYAGLRAALRLSGGGTTRCRPICRSPRKMSRKSRRLRRFCSNGTKRSSASRAAPARPGSLTVSSMPFPSPRE